ncbi:MAG: hypothetical protein EOO20_19930, partial [Chryseobacterium sp.]
MKIGSLKKILVLGFSFLVLHAHAGSEGRGGGDLDAVEFLMAAKEVGTWMKSSAIFNDVAVNNYLDVLAGLTKEMDGGVLAPIRFTDEMLTDNFGVSKMALFTKSPNRIVINRPMWAK